MLVGFFGVNGNATFTPPTGMTERFDTDSRGSGTDSEGTDATQATAGASGRQSGHSDECLRNIGHLIALAPQPATNATIFPEYQIVGTTGSYTANGTLGRTRDWAADIASYKQRPTPTPTSTNTATKTPTVTATPT